MGNEIFDPTDAKLLRRRTSVKTSESWVLRGRVGKHFEPHVWWLHLIRPSSLLKANNWQRISELNIPLPSSYCSRGSRLADDPPDLYSCSQQISTTRLLNCSWFLNKLWADPSILASKPGGVVTQYKSLAPTNDRIQKDVTATATYMQTVVHKMSQVFWVDNRERRLKVTCPVLKTNNVLIALLCPTCRQKLPFAGLFYRKMNRLPVSWMEMTECQNMSDFMAPYLNNTRCKERDLPTNVIQRVVLLSIFMILALAGNICILVPLFRTGRYHQPVSLFIISLATSTWTFLIPWHTVIS